MLHISLSLQDYDLNLLNFKLYGERKKQDGDFVFFSFFFWRLGIVFTPGKLTNEVNMYYLLWSVGEGEGLTMI